MGNHILATDSPAAASRSVPAPIDFGKLEVCLEDAACREVERLLHREARLLDTEQFSEWLEQVLDPGIRYVVASRELRYRKERRYNAPSEMFIFNDDFTFLKARVDQFNSGMQWRTDPPERYRRLVTNIEVFLTGRNDERLVRSNVLVQRSRRAYEIDQFTCCREDRVRRCSAGSLRLVDRRVDFDERSIAGRNLLLFL
ncbi:naphthalene 1,2-dioxygenase subunit beta [Panacagrimonas perspica]|uniref:Naphthalene 1,2-dioxygenase subunit beta n=1 Tax=Panacagrimonas perspica TaxID=381431 RepID=A0A4R7PDK4_9GAMM|nr:aromatic-ring-hydroxylating dioxygenase subunit beta [Panacagrimonas perspica]TDU31621.1 naphthalene 1,2-dioxygenase subunit beta [Panacagrimonas perspica]